MRRLGYYEMQKICRRNQVLPSRYKWKAIVHCARDLLYLHAIFRHMKSLLAIIFIIIGTGANAQIHEIGVFLGGSNFIGDVGATDYISPNEPAFGILYKWNRSPRHAWRFSLMHTTLKGDDLKSDVAARVQRGYKFKNDLTEVSAGLEFNFLDFNMHELETKVSPYIYTGLSYADYNGLFFVGGEAKSDAHHGALGVPMIVGVKGRFLENLVLGVEVGGRYTLKDDIDGSGPTNKNLILQKFGNTNSNDWYVFSGFTLTYTFGNKPCYCTD